MRGLFGALAVPSRKSFALDADLYQQLQLLGGYPESSSGISVNWLTALRVTTVLACVRVVANGVAQVPLKLYRPGEGGKGRDEARDHPLYPLLYRRPNSWQTSFEFRRTLVFHVMLTGGFFAFKSKVRDKIVELIPLEPGQVQVIRNRDLTLTYRVSGLWGGQQEFPQEAIWHVRGPSMDTWLGLDAVRLAREAIGLAVRIEDSQAKFAKGGTRMGGLFSVEGNLSEEQHEMLRSWIERQVADGNEYKPFILDRRAAFTQTQMSGVDAELVATRHLQIEEICRWAGVNPVMVGHSGQARPTFASAEQFFLAHVLHCLMPFYTDIEQSIDVNLIGDTDDGVYARFNEKALIRGAIKDQGDYWAKALGAGGSPAWMTQNEVREQSEENPLPGGDALPRPANIVKPNESVEP